MQSEKIDVFKVSFEEFLKWCELNHVAYDSFDGLLRLINSYAEEQLRINTKYVN